MSNLIAVEVARDKDGQFLHPMFKQFLIDCYDELGGGSFKEVRAWALGLKCNVRIACILDDASVDIKERYLSGDATAISYWNPSLLPNEFLIGIFDDEDGAQCVIASPRKNCFVCGAHIPGKGDTCSDSCRKSKSRKSQ